jgi:hypothetical protein
MLVPYAGRRRLEIRSGLVLGFLKPI